MVLLIAKNFQFVKLSQADLGTKNPASRFPQRLTGGYSLNFYEKADWVTNPTN